VYEDEARSAWRRAGIMLLILAGVWGMAGLLSLVIDRESLAGLGDEEPNFAAAFAALESAEPAARGAAIRRIARLGPAGRAAGQRLARQFVSESPELRGERRKARAEIGVLEGSGLAVLIRALGDPSRTVRARALELLAPMAGTAAKAASAVVPLLSEPELRSRAAAVLIGMGPAAAGSTREIAALLQVEDGELRRTLLEVLMSFGEAGIQGSKEVARVIDDGDLVIRRLALDLLGVQGARDQLGAIAGRLEDPAGSIRQRAAELLEELGPPASGLLPALLKIFEASRDPAVQRALVKSFAAMQGEAKAAIPLLRRARVNSDPGLRRRIDEALGALGVGPGKGVADTGTVVSRASEVQRAVEAKARVSAPNGSPTGEEPEAAATGPLAGRRALGWKSCLGCHGDEKSVFAQDAATKLFERILPGRVSVAVWWKGAHRRSYRGLLRRRGLVRQIAEKLRIADPREARGCVGCHNPAPPEEGRAESYGPKEGVSCESCHGPAEAWRRVHALRRKSAELQALGFRPMRTSSQRARTCVTCHGGVSAKLLEAGHPKLSFELEDLQRRMPPHWSVRDQVVKSSWAVGQAVALGVHVEGLRRGLERPGKARELGLARERSLGALRPLLALEFERRGRPFFNALIELMGSLESMGLDRGRLKKSLPTGPLFRSLAKSLEGLGSESQASMRAALRRLLDLSDDADRSFFELEEAALGLLALERLSRSGEWRGYRPPARARRRLRSGPRRPSFGRRSRRQPLIPAEANERFRGLRPPLFTTTAEAGIQRDFRVLKRSFLGSSD